MALHQKIRRKLGRRAFRNPTGDAVSVRGAEVMVDAGGKLASARKSKSKKKSKSKRRGK